MDKAEVHEIRAIICRVANIETIEPHSVIFESGVTSLDVLGLLFEMETVYGVSIPDEEFLKARTPAELCELINRLREEIG